MIKHLMSDLFSTYNLIVNGGHFIKYIKYIVMVLKIIK